MVKLYMQGTNRIHYITVAEATRLDSTCLHYLFTYIFINTYDYVQEKHRICTTFHPRSRSLAARSKHLAAMMSRYHDGVGLDFLCRFRLVFVPVDSDGRVPRRML